MSEQSVTEALKAIREGAKVGAREMARRLGMSSASTYLHYEDPNRFKAPYLPMDKALAFAEALAREGVDSRQILALAGVSEDGEPLSAVAKHDTGKQPGTSLIDVYNVEASAGHGSTISDEMVVDRLSFPANYLETITRTAPGFLAIIGVRGDSMLPTLKHEDAVMIDTTKKSLGFDGLFVLRFDGELHVKRVGRASEPGRVSIISDNRNEFPVFERRIEDVEVVGKVVWMGKKV